MTLRAIVVDDEPIARLRIRRMLDADTGVELIAECADGEAAVAAICRERSGFGIPRYSDAGMDGSKSSIR